MANPRAVSITLSDADRATLQSWARRRCTAQGLALRARIVLACAEPGTTNLAVAARLGISNLTVGKWRRRFAAQGIEGLADAPRSGGPRSILDEHIKRVITTTLESTPRSATHWSTRLLAKQLVLRQMRTVGMHHSEQNRHSLVDATLVGGIAQSDRGAALTSFPWGRALR